MVHYNSQRFAYSPPPRKITLPPVDSLSTKFLCSAATTSHTPTKQQFSSYNPIKTAFLDVVIAPAPFLFKIPYSLDTQFMLILILIDVQYSQKAVFNFEKGWNHQDHYSSGSLHLVKKSPPPFPPKFPPLGGIYYPPHLTAIWKTLIYIRICIYKKLFKKTVMLKI